MATAVTPKVFKNYINGEWVPARSGKAIEDRNPANTDELVGMFPASSAEDVNQAIDAAKARLQDVAPDACSQARRNSLSRRRNSDRSARKISRAT